jgi:hypothetical protein
MRRARELERQLGEERTANLQRGLELRARRRDAEKLAAGRQAAIAALKVKVASLQTDVQRLTERPDPIADHLLKHRVIVNLKSGGAVRGICLALTPEYIHLAQPEWFPEGREDSERMDHPAFVDRDNVQFFLMDK